MLRTSRGNVAGQKRPLRSIAIVDENPEQQYLYPEFLLFQRLFRRHGLQAVIADPSEFTLRDGVLWHGDLTIRRPLATKHRHDAVFKRARDGR